MALSKHDFALSVQLVTLLGLNPKAYCKSSDLFYLFAKQ